MCKKLKKNSAIYNNVNIPLQLLPSVTSLKYSAIYCNVIVNIPLQLLSV